MATWLVAGDVQEHVGGDELPPQLYLDAAATYVADRRPDLFLADEPPTVSNLPADVVAGTILMAGRLLARRKSLVGLANYGEFGPATILRQDPDIARLVGIGVHESPSIG